MRKVDFRETLKRYIKGKASAEECAYVDKWYEQVPDAGDDSNEEPTGEEVFEKISHHIQRKKGAQAKLITWSFRIAASVILMIAAGGIYTYMGQKDAEVMVGGLVPGKDKAILTLADGSVIELDSEQTGDLASEGGANITKLDSGTLSYTTGDLDEEVKFNEIKTPTGGQFTLRLPDGTKIWLNSVSSVRFPTRFTGSERKVFITGEVYFEVAHNKKMPFVVEVPGRQEITVLGTHFNVSAYLDEQEVKTTLVEGSVLVKRGHRERVVLQPGQQSVVTSGKSIETHKNIDVGDVLAWKEGFFNFRKTGITEIARQFSRWYGAEVIVEPMAKDQTFSGKIPRSTDIKEILQLFESTNTVKSRVTGKQIYIYLK